MWPADQLALREAQIYFFPEDGMDRAAHASGILQMRAALKTHAEHCWFPLEDTQVFCGKLDVDFYPPSMLKSEGRARTRAGNRVLGASVCLPTRLSMICPGIEHGISGSGGRRLIH